MAYTDGTPCSNKNEEKGAAIMSHECCVPETPGYTAACATSQPRTGKQQQFLAMLCTFKWG